MSEKWARDRIDRVREVAQDAVINDRYHEDLWEIIDDFDIQQTENWRLRAELEAAREISNSLYELHGVLRWHFEHQLISDSDGMGQLLYGAMVDLDTAVRKHGLARDNAPMPPFTPRDDALHSQHAITGEDTKWASSGRRSE